MAPTVTMDGASEDWPDFAVWRDAQSAADPTAPSDAEDTVIQMYTSGTTGLPKGNYVIHVWANNQGADTSTYETYGTATFSLL